MNQEGIQRTNLLAKERKELNTNSTMFFSVNNIVLVLLLVSFYLGCGGIRKKY